MASVGPAKLEQIKEEGRKAKEEGKTLDDNPYSGWDYATVPRMLLKRYIATWAMGFNEERPK